MISGKIQIQKYQKINKGTKNVRNPHILRTLPNFLVFLNYDFFGHHLNTPLV